MPTHIFSIAYLSLFRLDDPYRPEFVQNQHPVRVRLVYIILCTMERDACAGTVCMWSLSVSMMSGMLYMGWVCVYL